MANKAILIAFVFALALIFAPMSVVRCDTANFLCNMSRDGLQSCLPAVKRSGSAPPPTPMCCAAISKANITCLCAFKGSQVLSFYGIDSDLAMALPRKCNLDSATQCA